MRPGDLPARRSDAISKSGEERADIVCRMTPPSDNDRLAFLSDLPLPVTVRLGGRIVTVEELRAFQSGLVLPLDSRAGCPLDLFVGNVRLATAELVVKENAIYARVLEIVVANPLLVRLNGEAS